MSNLASLGSLGILPTYRVFDDFDTLFDAFLGDRKSVRPLSATPRVNVEETPGGYNIHMAAPGLSRSDFKIHTDGGYLTVSVDQKAEKEEKSTFLSREFSYESFSRSWKLPTNANAEGIGARYEAGVLTVSVPTSSKRSSRVEIKVE